MEAMIANWTPLGSSTAEAISETFFIRQGRLDRDGPNWKLFVQRKTVDVLVDQVPWGFGVIYHEWMPSPLQVNW